ncbi:MAG TPA: biopolymer transporter ExbD [Steroidobacteraceae bacterium]|jgi:biopolymer transport protein ExbD|nr:biopolymer transporter ExbD [Steroidobacteraceae bacterium]
MTGQSHLAEPQLNATPLIDVLLVLLVMLIFTLPIATHSVRLNLPQGRPGTPPPTVQLEILYRGEIYWNGQYIASIEELTPRLVQLANLADPPLVRVMPEKRAPYERVVQVLAAAQRSHVEKLTIQPVADL